jgi:hypothetical protein
VDLTGDGIPENVYLKLHAKSMTYPITWDLTILSKGVTIYTYHSDDTQIDRVFNEPEIFGNKNCHDYISCKKFYYFSRLLSQIPMTYDRKKNILDILKPDLKDDFTSLVYEYLDGYQVNRKSAKKILENIEKDMKNKNAIFIYHSSSPTESGPIMIFSNDINMLVPIYRP